MINKELNLSNLADFLKKNQIETFDEEIDKFGGFFITAARIAAVIIAPDPISKIGAFCAGVDVASLRASRLFAWLPDKFKYKDREKTALQKYELASYVNFILLQIAIKNGVKEIIMPYLITVLQKLELSDDDKKELERKSSEFDKERETLNIPTNCAVSKEDICSQANKIIDPVFLVINRCIEQASETTKSLKKIDTEKVKLNFFESVTLQYQAFLINFSGEFPEFALWADITQKEKIIKGLKDSTKTIIAANKKVHARFIEQTEQLIAKIEELKDNTFLKESGFPSFMHIYQEMFKSQEEHLSKVLKGRTIENITAHQNQIRSELNKPLSDNTDVDQIIYPLNKDIFVSQSFEAIVYRKKEHRKGFLTADSLGERSEKGENIGNYLLQTLVDPNYATKPIILLGNPGAGKSMLSKMFCGLLCETTDFIPFLIKLRSVASSSASISEHINKGLQNSIENTSDVNWLEWAKEFKSRIPVIIMDGFDELMQTSNRELNGYVDAIREFQEKAVNSGVCVRIILTSRVTVMQDVSIPEYTKIIKLDSFDIKRRDLWILKWNDAQQKPMYKFRIPENEKIELLAKEPLLMFMLAVYDFENGELQNMANDKSFNQSKLYDSLLNRFIKRQLEKNSIFKDASNSKKEKEEELFRLRLGMIALMMFMNDTTSRDTQKLVEEMKAFGILNSSMQTENVLGGFFFIHENKSTTESDVEKFNYEFLHKTFGEFLTADFMLRIAKKQIDRMRATDSGIISQKETFNFCFGYNWLHKHNNIQNFLFEHAKQIIKSDSEESKFIVNLIKTDLKELFDKGHQAFPVTTIRLLENQSVIEHLGIYSQNLVFLWIALVNEKHPVKFEIFDPNESVSEVVNEPKYESQDRDEINKNKLLWKRLSKLWALVENHSATAKLTEWVCVEEKEDVIELSKRRSEVIHNFSDSASVSCNDFELLLSYFDSEYKFSNERVSLQIIENITHKKPELLSLAVDVILYRFYDFYSSEKMNLLFWFVEKEISRKQQVLLIKKVGLLKWQTEPKDIIELIQFIGKEMESVFRENIQATTEYFKIVLDMISYFPLAEILQPKMLENLFHNFTTDLRRYEFENSIWFLEYIRLFNELYKHYPFRRKGRGDWSEEFLFGMAKEMSRKLRHKPYFGLEYFRLFNELRQNFPMTRIPLGIYEEVIHIISKDIPHLAKTNPQIILEYGKLLNDFMAHFPKNEVVSLDFVSLSIRFIMKEWQLHSKESQLNTFEFLKMIAEFGRHFPIKKFAPIGFVQEMIFQLSKEISYAIRDNSKLANEYLQVVKKLSKHYSGRLTIKDETIDENFFVNSKEFEGIIRQNPDSTLIYLELLLINRGGTGGERDDHMIERIVDLYQKRPFPKGMIAKAATILMQYNAPVGLIERLFYHHPKFKSFFSNSPELAKEILQATAELNSNERFN
ncbi:MAG: NACHT domain-containing protein [Proteobacteria bacterium]|nr:NACHT domain-containing protein [Pseudomonadota bacterium]